jgi:hypothetical protein
MGEDLFPDAEQILGLYHLEENIYAFGRHIFRATLVNLRPIIVALRRELIGLVQEPI